MLSSKRCCDSFALSAKVLSMLGTDAISSWLSSAQGGFDHRYCGRPNCNFRAAAALTNARQSLQGLGMAEWQDKIQRFLRHTLSFTVHRDDVEALVQGN